jgi:hypothetical protein
MGSMLYVRLQGMSQAWHWEACFTSDCRQCHRHDTGEHALRQNAGSVRGLTLGSMLYVRLQAMSQAWHWEACFTSDCRQCPRHDTGKHSLRPTAANVPGMTLGSILYVRLQAMSQAWHWEACFTSECRHCHRHDTGKHALRPTAGTWPHPLQTNDFCLVVGPCATSSPCILTQCFYCVAYTEERSYRKIVQLFWFELVTSCWIELHKLAYWHTRIFLQSFYRPDLLMTKLYANKLNCVITRRQNLS